MGVAPGTWQCGSDSGSSSFSGADGGHGTSDYGGGGLLVTVGLVMVMAVEAVRLVGAVRIRQVGVCPSPP